MITNFDTFIETKILLEVECELLESFEDDKLYEGWFVDKFGSNPDETTLKKFIKYAIAYFSGTILANNFLSREFTSTGIFNRNQKAVILGLVAAIGLAVYRNLTDKCKDAKPGTEEYNKCHSEAVKMAIAQQEDISRRLVNAINSNKTLTDKDKKSRIETLKATNEKTIAKLKNREARFKQGVYGPEYKKED